MKGSPAPNVGCSGIWFSRSIHSCGALVRLGNGGGSLKNHSRSTPAARGILSIWPAVVSTPTLPAYSGSTSLTGDWPSMRRTTISAKPTQRTTDTTDNNRFPRKFRTATLYDPHARYTRSAPLY